MKAGERDTSLDILRGLAILFVTIGHIPYTPYLVRAWLYTFHVPMFFLCSGILFSPDHYPRFRDFVWSRVRGLLIPLFSLGILSRILQLVFSRLLGLIPGIGPDYAVPFEPLRFVLELVIGYRIHTYYFSFWFLYALFLAELLFYWITRLLKRRALWYGLLVVCGIALQYLVSSFVQGFVWSLDLLPASLAFLSTGYAYRLLRFEKGNPKLPLWLLPVALCLSLVSFWFNQPGGGQVNLFYGTLGNPALYLVSALSGSCLFLILSQRIGCSKLLEFFGRNSLVTYAFQNPFSIPFMTVLLDLLATKGERFADRTFSWIAAVLGALLWSALLSVLINRFAPWMAGKRKVS